MPCGRRCGWMPVYPRVGGGNRHGVQEVAKRKGLSPRGRGKPTPDGPSSL